MTTRNEKRASRERLFRIWSTLLVDHESPKEGLAVLFDGTNLEQVLMKSGEYPDCREGYEALHEDIAEAKQAFAGSKVHKTLEALEDLGVVGELEF
jgi:hypothetical protein